jgi:hypothetical protein
VEAPAAGCARIDVVAGTPLALFEGRVVDDAGAVLGAGTAEGALVLFTCGRAKTRVDLEVRGRPGPFALTVRKEPWADPAFAARPLAASRLLARLAQGPLATFDGAAGSVKPLTLDASHVVTLDESIPPGKCLRVAVGAEGEGVGVDLRVFDAAGLEELDRAHGPAAVAARACAAPGAARAIKVELRAAAGKLDTLVATRTY